MYLFLNKNTALFIYLFIKNGKYKGYNYLIFIFKIIIFITRILLDSIEITKE